MIGEDQDLQLFQECFQRHGGDKAVEALRWQYLDTPPEGMYVHFAVDQNHDPERLAAIYASFPVRFDFFGRSVRALQSLDTLVDKDYRRQGLFGRTANSVFERAKEDGVRFIYGFPNDLSARGFFGKLEWRSLDPLPFLIKPLRANYFLERLKPLGDLREFLPSIPLTRRPSSEIPDRYAIDESLKFDDRHDRLWEIFARDVNVAVRRDQQYLRWRFEKKPESYRMLSLHLDDEVVAYVIYAIREKHGGKVGYVMEYLFHPHHKKAGHQLLRRVVNVMATEKCDAVLAWNFSHSPNHDGYRANHFLPFPEKLRPIKLHIGVRPLAEEVPEPLFERQNWYISYCDSDTV